MDVYHLWFDLRPGVSDVEFAERLDRFLEPMQSADRIAGYRLTRRKLGFGPRELGEFHVAIEVRDLAQLDRAFAETASRTDPTEEVHAAVNQLTTGLVAALYRDFPDPDRQTGQERF